MTVFTLGSITFNNNTADSDDIKWFGYVDGWDTLDNDVQGYSRPSVHGEITTSNLTKARQMTLFATAAFVDVECSDGGSIPDAYYTARDKLDTETAAFTQFAAPQLLLTHQEDVNRQLVVYRTSFRTRCLEGVAMEIELTLKADDPEKYVVS